MEDNTTSKKLDILIERLKELGLDYEIINRDPANTRQDGIEVSEGLATLIMYGDGEPLALLKRDDRRLSFKKIKNILGVKDLRFATKEEVERLTGCGVGYVSLYNGSIPSIVDQSIFEKAFVYGGTGTLEYDLKISPADLVKLTNANKEDITE